MLSKICNLSRVICSIIRCSVSKKGNFVGRDENGNSYYESNNGRRWVIYSKVSEPTTVTPEWHIWLHYSDDTVPTGRKKRTVEHIPNLTGTKSTYYPNQKVNDYYTSWNSNN